MGMSSPRAWGCFRDQDGARWRKAVFPTGVGMFPSPFAGGAVAKRLPHGRGDVSGAIHEITTPYESSPRAWGCFLYNELRDELKEVFPTGVGMFP